MRIKTRLLKKVKIHKSKDEKVPIAWEQGKEIPKLSYKQCLEIADLGPQLVKLLGNQKINAFFPVRQQGQLFLFENIFPFSKDGDEFVADES